MGEVRAQPAREKLRISCWPSSQALLSPLVAKLKDAVKDGVLVCLFLPTFFLSLWVCRLSHSLPPKLIAGCPYRSRPRVISHNPLRKSLCNSQNRRCDIISVIAFKTRVAMKPPFMIPTYMYHLYQCWSGQWR